MRLLWLSLLKLDNIDRTAQGVDEVVAFGKAAVPKLIYRLDNPEDFNAPRRGMWWARRSAARALEKIGDERAIGPLITLLDDGDHEVRLAAQEALQSFDTLEANQALETYDRRQQQILDEQIFFVHALRPKKDRWMVEALFLASGDGEWYPHGEWTAWRLGSQQSFTCAFEIIEEIASAVIDGAGVTLFNGEPVPLEEKLPARRVYRAAANIAKFFIEPPISASELPFFLSSLPNRMPCVYHVSVALNFRTWDQFPDTERTIKYRKWDWNRQLKSWGGKLSENDSASKLQKYAQALSPEPGQDMPVSVSVAGRIITGVLRLRAVVSDAPATALGDEPQGRTFHAELYLSDTIPHLALGTPLMRSVTWREHRTEKSIERQVAIVLTASLTPQTI